MSQAADIKKSKLNGHSACFSHSVRVATAPLAGRQASFNDTACQAQTLDNGELNAATL
jgi:hypothetical protein